MASTHISIPLLAHLRGRHLSVPAKAGRVSILCALTLWAAGCTTTKAYRIESLFGQSTKGTYFLERTFGQLYRDGAAWRLSPGVVVWTSADAAPLQVPVPGVLEYCPTEVVARCSTTRGILRFTPTLSDDTSVLLPDVKVAPQYIELAFMDPQEVKKAVTAFKDATTADDFLTGTAKVDVSAGNEIGSPEQHTGACPPGIPPTACSRRIEITMVDAKGNYLDPLLFVPVKNPGDSVLAPLLDKTSPQLSSANIHLFPNGSSLPADELPRSGDVLTVKADVDVLAVVKDLGPSACDAAGNCATSLPDQVPLSLKSLSYRLLKTTGQPVPSFERKARLYCLPRSFHKDEGSTENDTSYDEIYHGAHLPAASTDGLPYILTNLNSWTAAHCPAPPAENAESSDRLCFDSLKDGSSYSLQVSATDHADRTASADVEIQIALNRNIRKEIHSLTPEEIGAFRLGVALMKSRPASDPTSWIYQANMHGFPRTGEDASGICTVPPLPKQVAWESCEHGQFFFLSWHRMYLYYFERILRAAVREILGDPDYPFSIPYWDYSRFQELPEAFRMPADSTNPLWVAERRKVCNDGGECISDPSAKQALERIPVCNCPDDNPCDGCQPGLSASQTFGGKFVDKPTHGGFDFGELELQPHNTVHTAIGGAKGWMSWPECAARDPIFWLHHANIDRLWQLWLNQGGRDNPLGSTRWKTEPFTFFDEKKNEVKMTGCDILDMLAQLDYTYACLPINNVKRCDETSEGTEAPRAPAVPSETRTLAATEPAAVSLGNEPTRIVIPLADEIGQPMVRSSIAAEPQRLWLVIEGVELVHPGAFYQVFMNLPAGQAPDPQSIYYLGTLSLFGSVHEGAPTGSRSFDISETVHALERRSEWTGKVELTFVRGNPEPPEAEQPNTFLRFQRVVIEAVEQQLPPG